MFRIPVFLQLGPTSTKFMAGLLNCDLLESYVASRTELCEQRPVCFGYHAYQWITTSRLVVRAQDNRVATWWELDRAAHYAKGDGLPRACRGAINRASTFQRDQARAYAVALFAYGPPYIRQNLASCATSRSYTGKAREPQYGLPAFWERTASTRKATSKLGRRIIARTDAKNITRLQRPPRIASEGGWQIRRARTKRFGNVEAVAYCQVCPCFTGAWTGLLEAYRRTCANEPGKA